MRKFSPRSALVNALNSLDHFNGENYSDEINDEVWAAYDLLDNALRMLDEEEAAAAEDDDTDEEDF